MKYSIKCSVNSKITECDLNLEKESNFLYVITIRICHIDYSFKERTIWGAFNSLRITLENKNIFIICNATRLNYYPYSIQRNSEYQFLSNYSIIESSEKLFFNTLGKWCNQRRDTAEFFKVETEENSSVKNQKNFHEEWIDSLIDDHRKISIQKEMTFIEKADLFLFEGSPYNQDFVGLLLSIPSLKTEYFSEGCGFFEALSNLRELLEKNQILILCNGAAVNVYPSPMQFDSGSTEAYKTEYGKPALNKDLVDIFDYDPSLILTSIEKQDDFHKKWISYPKNK